MLLILKKSHKPRNGEDVDKLVRAEIPYPVDEPLLFDVIKRHNIHGPCGLGINPKSPCMVDGKCCKKFPKRFFNDATAVLTDSSVVYQRRDKAHGGAEFDLTVCNRKIRVDNRYVVPYNPKLSLMFDAHINVEIVNTVSSVKYLYKYTFKGSDHSVFKVTGPKDEIENFLVGRYVGASEAFWRIFKFEVLNKYPAVRKLALHLPSEQPVFFNTGDDAINILASGPPTTTLTAFFELNRTDDEACKLLYFEVPSRYRYNERDKRWQRRKNVMKQKASIGDPESDMIGRIPVVGLNSHQKELFFLRMLLHHIRGPKCYEDLRTVEGVEHPSFQKACVALGLFANNDEATEVSIDDCFPELF